MILDNFSLIYNVPLNIVFSVSKISMLYISCMHIVLILTCTTSIFYSITEKYPLTPLITILLRDLFIKI